MTRYAEDLVPGSAIDLGTHRVDRDAIIAFGELWDPLPQHTDEAAAAAGPFGGLIASGMHTLAVLQRLQVEGFYRDSAVIAGRGMRDVRLPRPVRPGDVLRGVLHVEEVRHREDGRAVVVTRGVLEDDDGRVVLEVVGEALMARRPDDDRPPVEDRS